jgi:predicted transposase YdaD
MDKTFEYCREYGIMDIYLEKRGGEAVSLLFEQYNYEDELRVVKEEALNEGLSMGRAEGREEERLASVKRIEEERFANAKRMKADGVEPALIARYTGLPIGEVKRL